MSVFHDTTPQPPLPTDKPDVGREADVIRSIHDAKRVLEGLIRALEPFEPTEITTADGKKVRALLQVLGTVPTDGTTVQMPFDLVAPDDPGEDGEVRGQINVNSLFLLSEFSTDDITVTGIGEDFPLEAGMYVYLQVDANENGLDIDEVSIVHDTDGFGDQRITVASDDDGLLWDQSFYPLAQVFENTNGKPAHGGTIFTSGDGNNTLEVVNLCSSHLGAMGTVYNGVLVQGVVKTAVTFDLSDD